jgi:CDP-4-dehydro-6-deoxyglucose reductase, E1
MSPFRIPLVRDTIGADDLEALAEWIRQGPRLTKGPLSDDFERRFAAWQGCPSAVYVNSGSSANLLAIDALRIAGVLCPGDRVIAPAVSWTTTVAPIHQLNLEPVLCDSDPATLGLDLDHLGHLCRTAGAKAVVVCHVLGIPNDMDRILALCEDHGLALIEDCCEALGSTYKGTKMGGFGAISTFSFYFGHHMSTVEGGMVCARDRDTTNVIKSLRSHGWNRDLDDEVKLDLRRRHDVDAFSDQYTFYHPGYNFRATDLGAFLGLRQLEKVDRFVAERARTWQRYRELMSTAAWRPSAPAGGVVSGFAWPMFSSDRRALAGRLGEAGVETRPLVCGSIGRQPWYVERYGAVPLRNADVVHAHGLYVPINPDLEDEELLEIARICLSEGAGTVRDPVG